MKIIKIKEFEVLVDDDVFEIVKDRKLYIVNGRVQMYNGHRHQRYISLHRFIMNPPEFLEVDHIDRNPLNNCRSNLRIADRSQNEVNKPPKKGASSKYKGVTRYIHRVTVKGKLYEYVMWRVSVQKNKKVVYVKKFKSEVEAAKAYDREAYKYFGEFAYLNFPELVKG